MKKSLIIITAIISGILLATFSLISTAQYAYIVDGTVTDYETGDSLAEVSVVIKDFYSIGTTTDINGYYRILGNFMGKKITFSYVGYETVTKTIKSPNQILNVALKPHNAQL